MHDMCLVALFVTRSLYDNDLLRMHPSAAGSPEINELPSDVNDNRVYFVVIYPQKTQPDATAFCAEHYGGTLANISTYDDLEYVNERLRRRYPGELEESLGALEMWVSGYTAARANMVFNFSSDVITDECTYV